MFPKTTWWKTYQTNTLKQYLNIAQKLKDDMEKVKANKTSLKPMFEQNGNIKEIENLKEN